MGQVGRMGEKLPQCHFENIPKTIIFKISYFIIKVIYILTICDRLKQKLLNIYYNYFILGNLSCHPQPNPTYTKNNMF